MQREHWSTSFGFIAAAVGCAVGLGNIWLFPWRLNAYGVVTFLVPYLTFTFGFVIFGLIAELALGRWAQSGAVGAFEKAFPKTRQFPAKVLGLFQTLAQTGLAVFYLVVVGWILHYLWLAISGNLNGDNAEQTFDVFTGSAAVLPWHAAAVLFTISANILGVKKGLERLNRWAVPGLFILLGLLILRSLTLPGALNGLRQALIPDWSLLLSSEIWVMALGQSFFTVSLGGMLIYGSYLKRDIDLRRTSFWIVIFNIAASLMAALVIIPAAIAFGQDLGRGPGLLFITMPQLFDRMPFGGLIEIVFFVGVTLAALSSAVNLLEIPTEAVMHLTGQKRPLAAGFAGAAILTGGITLALDMGRFGAFVDLVTIYLYPAGVLAIVLAGQWILGSAVIRNEINIAARKPFGLWLEFHLRFVFVAVCLLVIALNVIYSGI